jgi:antitoxin component YwqK of YwqJK toxin-antitoxin module
MGNKLVVEKWERTGEKKEEYYINEKGEKEGEYNSYYINLLGVSITDYSPFKNVKCYYNSDKLHGRFIKWHVYDGCRAIDCNYKYGKLEGEYKSWFMSGRKHIVCNYKNGMKEHKYTKFIDSDSGEHEVYHYVNDKKDGVAWHCRDFTHRDFQCIYKNDMKNGGSIQWNELGNICGEGSYKDDKKHGKFTTYHIYKPRIKCSEGEYKNDEEEGIWRYRYDNGLLRSITNYKNGKYVDVSTSWHDNGVKSHEHDHNTGIYISWYKNKQKEEICRYINGKKEGLYLSFYENGKDDTKCYYKKGEKHGQSIQYFSSGHLCTNCNYEEGKLNGLYTRYANNSKHQLTKTKECFYVKGMLEGEYKTWLLDGTLQKHYYYINGKIWRCIKDLYVQTQLYVNRKILRCAQYLIIDRRWKILTKLITNKKQKRMIKLMECIRTKISQINEQTIFCVIMEYLDCDEKRKILKEIKY